MFNNIITQLCLVTPTLTQICTFACCYQARSQKHKMKKKGQTFLTMIRINGLPITLKVFGKFHR